MAQLAKVFYRRWVVLPAPVRPKGIRHDEANPVAGQWMQISRTTSGVRVRLSSQFSRGFRADWAALHLQEATDFDVPGSARLVGLLMSRGEAHLVSLRVQPGRGPDGGPRLECRYWPAGHGGRQRRPDKWHLGVWHGGG